MKYVVCIKVNYCGTYTIGRVRLSRHYVTQQKGGYGALVCRAAFGVAVDKRVAIRRSLRCSSIASSCLWLSPVLSLLRLLDTAMTNVQIVQTGQKMGSAPERMRYASPSLMLTTGLMPYKMPL